MRKGCNGGFRAAAEDSSCAGRNSGSANATPLEMPELFDCAAVRAFMGTGAHAAINLQTAELNVMVCRLERGRTGNPKVRLRGEPRWVRPE